MAGGPPRPDTLKQADQRQMKITLADGAAHTFKGGDLILGRSLMWTTKIVGVMTGAVCVTPVI